MLSGKVKFTAVPFALLVIALTCSFSIAETTSQIVTSFSGNSNSSYPPHNALAVGPSSIVSMEGSRIAWTDLAGGAPKVTSVYTFFSSLSPTGSLNYPRAVYDAVNQRYVAIMQYTASANTISKIFLAVSKDSDPNHGWYFGAINTSLTIGGEVTVSDRPALAVDGSNIYISAHQFKVNASGSVGTGVWVIGKTAGAGGGIYGGGAPTVVANELTPSNQGIYYVVAGNNGKAYIAADWSNGSQIVFAVQTYDVATRTFSAINTLGLGKIDQGGSYVAQQLGTALLLNAGDKRLANFAYLNGALWAVAEMKPVGSSTPLVHWFKIDVTNPNAPSLIAQGDISGASIGANVATFNPSIALDAAGNVIVNFNASGPNMYPSDYYAFRGAPDTSFSAPFPYQASAGFFNSGNGSSVQNWGYYSSAIVDPNHPNSFWLSSEYVANGWWQTSIARVAMITGAGGGGASGPTISAITTSGAGVDAGGAGNLNVGKAVTFTVSFSGPVTVNTTGGAPTLTLNVGGTATYLAGSGGTALTFAYQVQAGENTPDLVVSSLNLNGSTIKDGSGNNAVLSDASNFNPPGILRIDTTTPTPPTSLSIDASTDSGAQGDGITNFTTVMIKGTAEAGAMISLYDAGNILGATTADATTGLFSLSATMSNGQHSVAASAADLAGNTSPASTPLIVVVDTVPPSAPTSLSIDPTTDSGALGDGVTSFTKLKISGAAEAGAWITLTDSNGAVIGSGLTDATGAFNIMTSMLLKGAHSITASAADAAGNASTSSAALSVTIQKLTYDHVVVVILENRSYLSIIGNPDAPFINSLATQGTLFADYWAITKPSQPNYLALFSGSTQGVTDDFDHFFPTAPTLSKELQQAGYSFVGYAESPVDAKHTPWISFGESQTVGQGFSQFPINYSTLPTVSFVIPNDLHNMHDGTIADADAWLSSNLGAYAAWAKTHNSLLVVTFDEDDGTAGQHIPTIVVGERVGAGQSDQFVNHYSLLHTVEALYELPGLTVNSKVAPEMTFAPVTTPIVPPSQINSSISGPSNSTYPPHNALCVGPTNVVTVAGTQIKWTNLTGGSATTQSVYSFFGSMNPTGGVYDQRCVYDTANQRFVVVMQHGASTASNIYIAVSKDSDPNHGWYFGSLNARFTINGQPTASDRPALAVDGSNIYVAASEYYANISGYVGTAVWVIGKTAGPGGGIYNGGTPTSIASELTPADQGIYHIAAGNNGKAYLAAEWWDGSQVLYALQTYDVATTAFSQSVIVGVGKIDQGGSYTAAQLGTSLLLDAGDKRVASLAYANSVLWALSEVRPLGSATPLTHWFQFNVADPANPVLLAQGDISGAPIGTNVATFNSSIAVDAVGNVIINFTASSPNMYPSDYYVYRTTDGGSFTSPILYQQSSGYFDSRDGSSVQRWGVNSSVAGDPNSPNSIWLSNEYVANGWWQTSVSRISIGGK